MPLHRATRRAVGALAVAAVVAGSFTAGAVLGAGSAPAGAEASGTVLDEAAARIAAGSLHPVDREELDAAAVSAMLRAAGDPWGQWQPGDGGASSYAGVGLWLRDGGDGLTVVARVAPGSPAAGADVRAGDEVRAVDDRTAPGVAPPVVASWLRGTPGTPVQVVLARGTAVRTVALTRAPAAPAEVAVRVLTEPQGPVAVVTVPAFERGTGRQVRAALAALPATAAGVVLDLRGNGGGLLDEAVETASAFLDGGVVVRCTRRDGSVQSFDAVGTGDTSTALVVLVDGGSASASEVVAGALHDRDRAVVVGSRTYGKGSVQEPSALSDGSSLQLTVASYTTPDGHSLEGVGLQPDIEVAAASAPEVALRRALDVLPGLVATAPGGRG